MATNDKLNRCLICGMATKLAGWCDRCAVALIHHQEHTAHGFNPPPGVDPTRLRRTWLAKIRAVYRQPVKARETDQERGMMNDLLDAMVAVMQQQAVKP